MWHMDTGENDNDAIMESIKRDKENCVPRSNDIFFIIATFDDFRYKAFFGCYPRHGTQPHRMHPSEATTPHLKAIALQQLFAVPGTRASISIDVSFNLK